MPNWITSAHLRDREVGDSQFPAPDLTLLKASSLEKFEEMGDRRIRFVISTGDVDRDNDTIEPAGWDLASFRQNPVVLWAHSHKELPIGKAIDISIENGKLMAVAEFAQHPLANTVFELLKGGFLRATSVGFRALEFSINEERHGVDFKRQELLEFSVVPVPANQHALVAAEMSGIELEPLRKWVVDTLAAWPGEMQLPGRARKAVEVTPAEKRMTKIEAKLTEIATALSALAAKGDERDPAELAAESAVAGEAPGPVGEPVAGPIVEPEAEPVAEREPEPVAVAEPVGEADPVEEPKVEASAREVVLTLTEGDDVLLELTDDEDDPSVFDVAMIDDLRSVLREVVGGAMGDVVRAETRRALNTARGRVE